MRLAAYKVPDGKLLKVRVNVEDGKIEKLVLMGDFFMHPEDALFQLELRLVGLPLDQEMLTNEIEQFLSDEKVTLIGASAGDFATVIIMAK